MEIESNIISQEIKEEKPTEEIKEEKPIESVTLSQEIKPIIEDNKEPITETIEIKEKKKGKG